MGDNIYPVDILYHIFAKNEGHGICQRQIPLQKSQKYNQKAYKIRKKALTFEVGAFLDISEFADYIFKLVGSIFRIGI